VTCAWSREGVVAAPDRPVRWGRADRLELKYCVPEDVADAALGVARLFLRPERGLAHGEAQIVTSLYLDTPDLRFMRAHLDGAHDRFKLRVRAYGPPPWPEAFAEIKQKRGGICRKRRAPVPAEHLHDVLSGADLSFARVLRRDAAAALQEFVWRRLTCGAEPMVLVRSHRESLRGSSDDQIAVTVDRSVAWQRATRLDMHVDPGAWRHVLLPQHAGPATAVLELKHARRPPAWMSPLIARLAPWRVSFSKYVAAATALRVWETRR